MKTSSLLALGAVLCLLLTACVPTSDSPLSSADTAQIDPALVGNWLEHSDQYTYHITKKDQHWLHLEITKQSGEKTDSYDFFTTTIGANTYANVVPIDKDHPTKAFTFIRYTISTEHDQIKMWSMSQEVAAAAVRAGKIKGTLTHGDNPDVTFTDTSHNLAKFIQDSDLNKLFTNEAVLVKIDPATK